MKSPWVNDSNAALVTDLYELTMLQSYFNEGMNDTAVFDLFIRRLPVNRNYFVACGLEHVLHYLESMEFSEDGIEYLRSLGRFSEPFLQSLRTFRFTGDVYAVPEGTAVFVNEPLIEVLAPLREAQLIETFVMNQIQLGSLAASKAARVVSSAKGRAVVDFGARRMHGADAAIKEPRAFYIGGVDSTSSVLAGRLWGIPVSGTMAHSYIMAFEDELEAFRRFVRAYPDAILLVDTYGVNRGLQRVIHLARELGADVRVTGVRLDSGDVAIQARDARQQLDAAGLNQLKIFASNSLDEYEIDRFVRTGVPIDGFGVGGHLATSSDAPVLDTAYKLVEYAGSPRIKLSESKTTLPGRKQVFRQRSDGKATHDVIGLAEERDLPGEPLLVKVMEGGKRTMKSESVETCRARCKADVNSLPQEFLALPKVEPEYPVELSPRLDALRTQLSRKNNQ